MGNYEAARIIDEVCKLSSDTNGVITRFPFTDSWMRAQEFLRNYMLEHGFEVGFDCAGNLHGRIGSSEKTVLSGSHVDTVRNGGKYDGLYGVVAAVLAVSRLYKKHGTPKHALEVVSFSEEEGSRFPFNFLGSKALIGSVNDSDILDLKDKDGVSMKDAMSKYGFEFKTGCAKRDDIKAFVEIHIEQGGVLESKDMDIGIVTSIVGYKKFRVDVHGEANHAGTTPMPMRKDAGFASALIISEVIKCAKEYGEPLVTTVGQIEFHPGLANVIPQLATFSLDMRHTDGNVLDRFQNEVSGIISKICAENNVSYEFKPIFNDNPVPMDKDITAMIAKVCDLRGLRSMEIHSGAGHDSQILSKVTPVGMIFVPSKDGISHNPNEHTDADKLELGVEVLEDVLYKLAY